MCPYNTVRAASLALATNEGYTDDDPTVCCAGVQKMVKENVLESFDGYKSLLEALARPGWRSSGILAVKRYDQMYPDGAATSVKTNPEATRGDIAFASNVPPPLTLLRRTKGGDKKACVVQLCHDPRQVRFGIAAG